MVTNQYSTGTTIIALKYDKGIMIGSDSQTSSGSMIINRSASKITKISNNGVLCRSGSASDTQFLGNLLRMLNYEYFLEKNKDMRIRSIVQIARNICYKKKQISNYGFICCGWDSVHGGQIYSIVQGGGILQHNIAYSGSGSIFLNSFLDSRYKETIDHCQSRYLITKALVYAMNKDGNSGGIVRICDISKNGIKKFSLFPYSKKKYTLHFKFSNSIMV
jgi:20S proteasome subunit beta 1